MAGGHELPSTDRQVRRLCSEGVGWHGGSDNGQTDEMTNFEELVGRACYRTREVRCGREESKMAPEDWSQFTKMGEEKQTSTVVD